MNACHVRRILRSSVAQRQHRCIVASDVLRPTPRELRPSEASPYTYADAPAGRDWLIAGMTSGRPLVAAMRVHQCRCL